MDKVSRDQMWAFGVDVLRVRVCVRVGRCVERQNMKERAAEILTKLALSPCFRRGNVPAPVGVVVLPRGQCCCSCVAAV